MVLQSGASITKQIGAGITKWDSYYKVGQYNLPGDRQSV